LIGKGEPRRGLDPLLAKKSAVMHPQTKERK